MPKSKIAIVGGGPVGLFGCLMLQSFGVDFVCYEKFEKLRSHPSAHWVSARSKLLFSQIDGLAQKFDKAQETFEHFRHYRYMDKLGGFEYGHSDHFSPSIQQKLAQSHSLFGQYPNHISQSKLLKLEFEHLKQKDRVIFNSEVASMVEDNGEYELKNYKDETIGRANYVILCNGLKSKLREDLKIKMAGKEELIKIINIHFKSKQLANLIRQYQNQAMLHFFYNETPSVLVNHSLQQGQFVIQIPNYQPIVDLAQVYSPVELLKAALSPQVFSSIKDLQIIHVGNWKCEALLADTMVHGNIFLAGDTAHTYTPAGGFGMNCGFQDMHQLTHTLHTILRNPQANRINLLKRYNQERLSTNQKYLEKSLANYRQTQHIGQSLGLPVSIIQYYKLLPFNSFTFGANIIEKIRLGLMSSLLKKRTIEPKLDLFYDKFDFSVQRLSSIKQQIVEHNRRRQFYDFWVDSKFDLSKLKSQFGQIAPENIKLVNLPQNEKVIGRDSLVIL